MSGQLAKDAVAIRSETPPRGEATARPFAMRRSESGAAVSITLIEPRSSWKLVDLRELWRYRELLWILAARDTKVRYKQTIIGASWAILQPLITMLVFSSFFAMLGRVPAVADGIPYAISLYCALLPWQLFSKTVTQAGESLVSNQVLITKVYLPRIIIPLTPALTGLIDFGISLAILLAMMAWSGIAPTAAVVTLPLFIGLTLFLAFACGVWLAALTALYRENRPATACAPARYNRLHAPLENLCCS